MNPQNLVCTSIIEYREYNNWSKGVNIYTETNIVDNCSPSDSVCNIVIDQLIIIAKLQSQ